jgi:hypothetical protein
MVVSEDVRQLALHPFREAIAAAGWERIEGPGILVCTFPLPMAKIVEPIGLEPDGVAAAVLAARAIARERGELLLAWWLAPEHASLGIALEELGLINEQTPGFEAVENAMALVDSPAGEPAAGIVVSEVDSFEDFAASSRVSSDAFELPLAMREEIEASLPQQYAEYATPGNAARQFNAAVDGVVVGTASTVLGHAGVNLFGGSVVSWARGKGVYRALTHARWKFAVDAGVPALTVQAGRMSRPIVEQLGFTFVASVRVYVDDLSRR